MAMMDCRDLVPGVKSRRRLCRLYSLRQQEIIYIFISDDIPSTKKKIRESCGI